jgi:radical SAM protein with 4Fe4S-binding SPASM domain
VKEAMGDDSLQYMRDFTLRSALARLPVSGSIELTRRCNLRCVHCYLPRGPGRPGREELGTSQILSLLEELSDAGCLFLLLTGGEPLLRPDFADIYTRAKERGMLLSVFSNGTMISDEIAGLFSELPPYSVEISVYGASEETYNKITGSGDAFERCMDGIRKLAANGVCVKLKAMLMTMNSHEFKEIEGIASDAGLKFRLDAALFPRLDRDSGPTGLRVGPEEATSVEFQDQARALNLRDYYLRTKGAPASDSLYVCGAGLTSFHIDAYGRLKPCLLLEDFGQDVSGGGFLDAWNGAIAELREKKLDEGHECSSCDRKSLCNYCPAFFHLENGSEKSSSDYLCSIGKTRLAAIEDALTVEDG